MRTIGTTLPSNRTKLDKLFVDKVGGLYYCHGMDKLITLDRELKNPIVGQATIHR